MDNQNQQQTGPYAQPYYPPQAYQPGAYPPGSYPPQQGGYAQPQPDPVYQGSINTEYAQVLDDQYKNDYQSNYLTSLSPFDVRIGFIRKVYLILFAQLATTAILSFIPMQVPAIGNAVVNSFPILIWITTILSLVLVILLACVRPLSRSVPINYILLFLFTLCITYEIAGICTVYQQEGMAMEVYLAAGATAAITGGLTVQFPFSFFMF